MKLFFCSLLICSASGLAQDTLHYAFHPSAPYRFVTPDGVVSGMDMDILQRLEQELGVHIEPVQCPFSRCLLMMEEGNLDLISGILKSDERQRYMNYIEPPYYRLTSYYSFYKLKTSDIRVTLFDELKPYTVAYTRGALYFPRFDKEDRLRKVPTVTETAQIQMLLKGRVDLIIGIDSTLDLTLVAMGIDHLIEPVTYQEARQVSSYMALSRASRFNARTEDFSRAIRKLQSDGTLEAILQRYGMPAQIRD